MENKGMGIGLLKYFCEATYGQIAEMFDGTIDSKGSIFIDNDSQILAVAHMDVVNRHQRFELLNDKNTIFNPQLDDRLGIYALYVLWKKHGLKFDILLTIDEEKMNSSAQFFKTSKNYNWMFQFDRAGTDQCVMYQYDNTASEKLLNSVGVELHMGSYSDIAELDHLGCIGFNWGVAYYRQHTRDCYMRIDEFKSQVRKFMKFYELYKDTAMPFDKAAADKAYNDRYFKNYGGYSYPKSPGVSANDFNDTGIDWENYYYENGSYILKGSKYDKRAKQPKNEHEERAMFNEETISEYLAMKARENKSLTSDEQKYYDRYSGGKIGQIRKRRGKTKVKDLREKIDVEKVNDIKSFNTLNDEYLNEFFGGVVTKHGVEMNVFWKGGRAYYEPVQKLSGAPVVAPEHGSRDWYMSLPTDEEIMQEQARAEIEMALRECDQMDAEFHARIVRDV